MLNKEKVRKIFENLYDDVEVKKAYYDGYIQGLKNFRDNLIMAIDNEEKNNQENVIKVENIPTDNFKDKVKIINLKFFDKALSEEELKEILKNDSND